jgi:myo-inositol-1(or 4)-monophosphatase
MVTEAGGLVGNFTGEADYLYQREVIAGNPKIYAQLVQTLAPYTRVVKDSDVTPAHPGAHAASGPTATAAAAPDATAAFAGTAAATEPTAPARKLTRVRKPG